MKSKLLDLDSQDSWHPDFCALLYAQDIWARIEAKLDAAEPQSTEFLAQITCAEDSLRDEFAKFLRSKAREILYGRYSHVVGYHGCRMKHAQSYLTRGIVSSDTSSLISEARLLFGDIQGFDEALQDIGLDYLNHNQGKVGILLSCIRAKHDRNTYVRGSELVRGLANRLGTEAKLRLAQTGKRSLIKCAIQTAWLEKCTTFSAVGAYSNHVLEYLIQRRRWSEDNFIGFGGGYMITRSIPPENILELIDMTDFSDDDP